MSRRPSPLPVPLSDAPFPVSTGRELGLSVRRLRARDLDKPFHGVRAAAEPQTVADRCAAYLPRLGPGQVFSHQTAAALWGMPLPATLASSTLLHVLAVSPAFAPQGRGVVGHATRRVVELAHVGPFPVVRAEVALLQLAPRLRHRALVQAGDHLVRRRDPLSSLDAIRDLAAASRGAPGIDAFRRAVDDIRSGTDSPMESALRSALTAFGLPEPIIGIRIHDESGRYLGTPDLAYPAERIAIEYEGDYHREKEQFRYDIRRREQMEAAGWRVVRVVADHLANATEEAALAERIRKLLRSRGPARTP